MNEEFESASITSNVIHVDVIIVGAGLSGISAAYHLQKYCPAKTYLILEGRDAMGGTWDFFRYPGVRSDSDMYTLGYSFEPWNGGKMFSEGPEISDYVNRTAAKYDITKNIRFGRKVKRASWSSVESEWLIEVEASDSKTPAYYSCNFMFSCCGYYDYEEAYQPEFRNRDAFEGEFVHPQFWPEGLDYKDKEVIVIGSGATAVTLLPAMAGSTRHITMLQRSPTYILPAPDTDIVAKYIGPFLPKKVLHAINRWKYITLVTWVLKLSKWKPGYVRKALRRAARQTLGLDYDVDTHFKPSYQPWDQRLCADPDGLFYQSIADGDASVVTDHIEEFTRTGIRLESGRTLKADIIVSATGLKLIALGGMDISVDGKPFVTGESFSYKGMMFSGLPNFVQCFGYAQAGSYTLKVDLTCQYACRLINLMDTKQYDYCVPENDDPNMEVEDMLGVLSSGYVQRAAHLFPKVGKKAPWKRNENYFLDLFETRFSPVQDEGLAFYCAGNASVESAPQKVSAA
ncbi:MAG: NAD(P)/FAD-dependent oxidoreductase [Halioglobus sp.]|nr:NAD(P)/FAD-dependent oxidoreductase [Halioglobus sp.]